ncbi:MAG: 6-pyruvoyl-tetrahydropterin synthase-related protein [Candidatus Pacearchaeota archaeon]
MNKNILYILLLFLTSIILFYEPLTSGLPLGIDTLGHLSKVSYIKEYPFASWDMSWYSGTPFLKIYSPLFYYLAAIFPSPVSAGNYLSFASILLSSIGIYLFLNYKTNDKRISFLGGLSFLTVLSISYYWISTGNLPYFFALWTIPFFLYFLEKSVNEKKKIYFIFCSLIFFIGILAHIIIGFLIGLIVILRFLMEGLTIHNFKKILLYGAIPVLLSSFWLVPFLNYIGSPETNLGYIPPILFLFGFGNCCWGLQAGGIGVLFFLFIPALLIFFLKKYWKDKLPLFSLAALIPLGFLLFGGLGNKYPYGVDPVRFVIPFSFFLIFFIASVIHKTELLKSKIFLSFLILILIIGVTWNYKIINKNFEDYSYSGHGSRLEIIQEVISSPDFPIHNEFTNYRFGTSRYVFGETINYFYPKVSHNFGYQDLGMLNPVIHNDFIYTIWHSEDIEKSVWYLDWFGIKYFEGTNKDSIDKFRKDERFREIKNFYNDGYSFTLFEYKNAKKIVSLVNDLNSTHIGAEKSCLVQRTHPDKVIVTFENFEEDDAVVFKEFFDKSWRAKDYSSQEKLKIIKTDTGFMAVYPKSNGVIFYQKKTLAEIMGIFLSIISVIILIFVRGRNY